MPRTPALLAALCLLALTGPLRADFWRDAWLDPAELEAVTLGGGSGMIHAPAAQSLPDGEVTAGLHAYRLAVERGFPYGFEAGLQMELDGLDQDGSSVFKRELIHARWAILQPDRYGLGLAVGVEGVGLGDLGFNVSNLDYLASQVRPGTDSDGPEVDRAKATALAQARHLGSLQALQRQYVVLGGPIPRLPMAYAEVGYDGGRVGAPQAFGAIAIAPVAGAAVFAEYDRGTNIGARLLLSTQIKMDLSVSDIQSIDWQQSFDLVMVNNVRFGVSYSEFWP
jgi:hypothetical protein